MPAAFPAASNVFVKNHEASGKLVVDFSRNVKKFALNRYAQIIPVKKVSGYYLDMTVEEAGRILQTDGAQFLWYDGQPAPEGNDGTESFIWREFMATRRVFPVTLGDMMIDMADWNILAQHLRIKAQQAMTWRTQMALTQLLDSGNYPTGHYSAVASITGNTGTWAASTTARQDIKRSLNYAAEKILDSTLAAVEPEDLMVVFSSSLAKAISECQEIVDHIKGSPDALAQVKGELPGKNAMYGLPDKLYGFPVEIEKTRKVTTKKGATTSISQVFTTTSAAMVSRVGGLEGVAEAPNFSSLVLFVYEKDDMTAETKNDPDNRRTLARVVDTAVAKLVGGKSSFLFTSAQ